MGAEAVGAGMPIQVTLDDLVTMAAADENHRYELSPEGVLWVAPVADPDHALLVSRLFAWFLANGYGPDEVVADCGIDVGGGRVPDLTVWIVERDTVTSVHRYILDGDKGVYELDSSGARPLTWLLSTTPDII